MVENVVPVKVLAFDELLERAHPEVGLERDEEKHAGVDKAVILAIVAHHERLDAAVHFDELPKFVKYRLVECQSKGDLLEDVRRF